MKTWMIAPLGLALLTAACGSTDERRAATGALGGAAAGAVVGGPVGAAVGAGAGAAGGAYRDEAEAAIDKQRGQSQGQGQDGQAAMSDPQRKPMDQAAMAGGPSNEEVRTAQQALKDMGLYDGDVDGLYGPRTIDAVAQYQRRQDMAGSGELDQRTLDSLTQQAQAGDAMQQQQPDQQDQQQQLGQQPEAPAPAAGQTDQPTQDDIQQRLDQQDDPEQGQSAQ